MTEQWQELKETIIEMRDNGGTGTQEEVCIFLVSLMEILEKQIQQLTDTKETIIKSALKYLVKKQIEEGSVGFAVDNDHDHDCCWDDVLAWIEAQPCENAVSREAVLDIFNEWFATCNMADKRESPKAKIRALPSVTPQVSEEDIHREREQAYMLGYEDASKKFRTQPSEDCISREETLKAFAEECGGECGCCVYNGSGYDTAENCKLIKSMPSVTPTSEDIKEAYLKGYDYGVKDWFKSKTQPCEDAVRREAVKNGMIKYGFHAPDMTVTEFVEDCLPSVTPERTKGKWIKCKSRFGVEYFKCSECGRKLHWIDRDDNYCSDCGSDNSESTKVWFKEWDTKLAEMSGGGEE